LLNSRYPTSGRPNRSALAGPIFSFWLWRVPTGNGPNSDEGGFPIGSGGTRHAHPEIRTGDRPDEAREGLCHRGGNLDGQPPALPRPGARQVANGTVDVAEDCARLEETLPWPLGEDPARRPEPGQDPAGEEIALASTGRPEQGGNARTGQQAEGMACMARSPRPSAPNARETAARRPDLPWRKRRRLKIQWELASLDFHGKESP
jgi:hypothetical protein